MSRTKECPVLKNIYNYRQLSGTEAALTNCKRILMPDYAKSCASRLRIEKLSELEYEILPYPLEYPDLLPTDSHVLSIGIICYQINCSRCEEPVKIGFEEFLTPRTDSFESG